MGRISLQIHTYIGGGARRLRNGNVISDLWSRSNFTPKEIPAGTPKKIQRDNNEDCT